MPRNGSGLYTLSDTLTANTLATAEEVNAILQDMADALTASVAADNQTPITAAGNAANKFAPISQLQGGAFLWGGTAGGTATALTCSLSPAITAYAAGTRILVVTSAAAEGASDVAVNGLAAKAIKTTENADIAAGDWASGALLDLVYDGTAFRRIGPSVRQFVSTAIPIVVGTASFFSHGLGGVPTLVKVELVCTTDEGGYAAGDVVELPTFSDTLHLFAAKAWWNATVVGVQIGDGGFYVLKRSSPLGTALSPSVANWELRVRAFR